MTSGDPPDGDAFSYRRRLPPRPLPALYRILLSELKRLLIGLTAKVPVTTQPQKGTGPREHFTSRFQAASGDRESVYPNTRPCHKTRAAEDMGGDRTEAIVAHVASPNDVLV